MTSAAEGHAHDAATSDQEDFDLPFIDGMIVHHRGAIDMANEALDESQHDELRTFAQGIIDAQTAEIAQMQGWREAWFAGEPQSEVESHEMGEMSISEDSNVPFDQRFLQAMISHHEGALSMAGDAISKSEHDEIRTLATTIQQAQQAEIAQMRAWLQEWYGIEE